MGSTSPTPKTSERGIALIKKWESFFARAYLDPVNVWTIGWGTITDPALGIFVKEGMVIDRATGEKWMRAELTDKEARVYKMLRVPVTQNQFDALMSFTYNTGTGNLAKSTLLKVLNQGKYEEVPAQLMRWVNGQDRKTGQWKKLRGLENRRRDECRMWNGEKIAEIADTPTIRLPGTMIVPTKNTEAAKETMSDPKVVTASGTAITTLGAALTWMKTHPEIMIVGAVVLVAASIYIYKRFRAKQEFTS